MLLLLLACAPLGAPPPADSGDGSFTSCVDDTPILEVAAAAVEVAWTDVESVASVQTLVVDQKATESVAAWCAERLVQSDVLSAASADGAAGATTVDLSGRDGLTFAASAYDDEMVPIAVRWARIDDASAVTTLSLD